MNFEGPPRAVPRVPASTGLHIPACPGHFLFPDLHAKQGRSTNREAEDCDGLLVNARKSRRADNDTHHPRSRLARRPCVVGGGGSRCQRHIICPPVSRRVFFQHLSCSCLSVCLLYQLDTNRHFFSLLFTPNSPTRICLSTKHALPCPPVVSCHLPCPAHSLPA